MTMSDLVQTGFFDAPSIIDDDTIVISADWIVLSDEEFKQEASKLHRILDQQESVIDALKNKIIREKGELYLAAKAKLGHGKFHEWLEGVGVSHSSANEYMLIVKRLGDDISNSRRGVNLSLRQWREIARSPERKQIVAKIESGDLEPTAQAVSAEIEATKRRAAEEAARKAHADALAAQQELFLYKESATHEIEELGSQIQALKEEMATLTSPEIEIREIAKEVIPPSVTLKVETLQEQVNTLTLSLESQKETISPETQKKMETLQKQLDKLKEERKLQESTLESQKERIHKLNADIDTFIHKREFAENADRIRQGWRLITSEAHSCLMRLLGQWPTPIDVQAFDADDWARVDHLKSTLQRVLEECNHLRFSGEGIIVDMNTSTRALSLNGQAVVYDMEA
jgi:hypothetical protein